MKAIFGNCIRTVLDKLGLSVVRSHQTYEADRRATMKSWRTDLVIDVGANVGQYASKLRRDGFRGEIVSLEPLPDAFIRLQQAMNSDLKWRGINAAAGPSRSTATLNVSEDSVCSSLLKPSKTLLDAIPTAKVVKAVTVDVIPLDELDYPKCDSMWLKLDVQGFEKQALEGAKDLLKKVNILELELGLKPSYYDSYTLADAIPDIQDMGFSLVSIGRGASDSNTGQLIDADILFERF